MGCRHLICIYSAGRFIVAQYGGHDGDPSYTGLEIMTSLTPQFVRRLRAKLFLIQYRVLEDSEDYVEDDMGVAILDDIAYAKGPLEHSFALAFADDGIFCEWTYVIDLDAEVLEVYYGDCGEGGVRMRASRGPLVGRLGEVNVWNQKFKVAFPFIDLPGDKTELLKACTAGLGLGDDL